MNLAPRRLLLASTLALVACNEPAARVQRATSELRATPGGADIITFGVDNARTNWNRVETTLTPANVRPETFGRLGSTIHTTEGDVQGQPLFLSNHMVRDAMRGADVRSDVVFVATMEDHVYALDADDLHVMWQFDFEGRHFAWADDLQRCQSHYPIGVMSTPVISADHSTLYVVGRVQGSTPTDTWLQGYALRTRDGTVAARFRVGETVSAGGTRTPLAVDGNDRGRTVRVTFTTRQYTQRSALLLVGNTLYVSTGGICDTPGFRGWMLAFDTTRLSESTAPRALYTPTPSGGGGIWAVGGAASDGTSVFIPVGNGRAAMRAGTADAQRSIGDALVRTDLDLRLDTRACFNTASPAAACGTGDANNLRNVFMPRNAELLAREDIPDMDPAMDIGDPDEDFGSTGPLLIPPAELTENRGIDDDRPILAVAGKDGFLFLLERARLGGQGPSPLAAPSDVPRLVGTELWGQELFQHSTSGGIRTNLAYFETRSGRYLFALGADEIGGRPDTPRGLAALRLTRASDPTPDVCATQYRRTAFQNAALGCATIWGSQVRPAYQLAWSGGGPLLGGTPFVTSNHSDQGIVWVSFETNTNDADRRGLLVAYAADQGAVANRVFEPLYRSDRVEADQLPAQGATFGGPIAANGRVYVPCGVGIAMYGPVARRTLPPVPVPPTPPACAENATWEGLGQPFMSSYCVFCHDEYRDLGFIRRRAARVAESILPAGGDTPSMPLQRDGRPFPNPSDAERAAVAAWIRCGAPSETTRLHAGYEDLPSSVGTYSGDAYLIDPSRPGALTDDLLGAATLTNPYAPAVPDAAFRVQRQGPARWSIPIPGRGQYAVSMYFAENVCVTGAPSCRRPFDVLVEGSTALRDFDIVAAGGGPRRVVGRSQTVYIPSGNRITIEMTDAGRLHALEVTRTGRCSGASDCPRLFQCVSGACQPTPMTDPGYDGGVYDVPAVRDVPVVDAGIDASTVDAPAVDAPPVDRVALDANTVDTVVVGPDAPAIDAPRADVTTRDVVGQDEALPPSTPPKTGCHCRTTPGAVGSTDLRALGLALAAMFARRRGRRLPGPQSLE